MSLAEAKALLEFEESGAILTNEWWDEIFNLTLD